MSRYTTGELAKLCHVTVRTVQFYDAKGLLKPTQLTQGGRRQYSDDALKKLRLICLLKSLGLSLDAIGGILQSQKPEQVLLPLLDEQQQAIDLEIKAKKRQLQAVRLVKESVLRSQPIPIHAISDIEQMVNHKKKRRNTMLTMLGLGFAAALLLLLLTMGYSLAFEIGFPILVFWAIRLRLHRKNTAYVCVQCNAVIHPTIPQILFSRHTPGAMKLRCPGCKVGSYCVQVHPLG